jgi:hypothetical protein
MKVLVKPIFYLSIILLLSKFFSFPSVISTVFLVITSIFLLTYIIFKRNTYGYKALAAGYLINIIGIILFFQDKISIEWAFVFFILTTFLFGITKTDSRFLILPAILGLAYLPFLLIAKKEAFAENIAIFVYYWLVVGVILQIIEYKYVKHMNVDFTESMKWCSKNKVVYLPAVLLIIASIIVAIIYFVSPTTFPMAKYNVAYATSVVVITTIITCVYNRGVKQ